MHYLPNVNRCNFGNRVLFLNLHYLPTWCNFGNKVFFNFFKPAIPKYQTDGILGTKLFSIFRTWITFQTHGVLETKRFLHFVLAWPTNWWNFWNKAVSNFLLLNLHYLPNWWTFGNNFSKAFKRCASYPKLKVERCHPVTPMAMNLKFYDMNGHLKAPPRPIQSHWGDIFQLSALDNLHIFYILFSRNVFQIP